ncbi:diphosphomevalonate decarboxylase [Monosporozyma servazzii]
MAIYTASATAPVNIATLKYWGKRDVSLNLPTNSSISITLSQDDLRTLTTAATSESFSEDQLWLNGHLESLQNKRTQDCLRDLRQLRSELEQQDESLPALSQWKLHLVSENNFPTAAGLASSAAGFAAMVVAIAQLYQLPQSMSELSKIARKGSGSACRSLFGGYVAWEMGQLEDGSDSKAIQVLDRDQWPEMKALILVVSDVKKDVSSTQGMQLTVATSDLFKHRVSSVVPERYETMKDAIKNKDFNKFAELTMRDSNSFHATCLDSFPPIFYINDTSKRLINLCHKINSFYSTNIVAYTFDAGPNAVLYYLKENEHKLLSILNEFCQDINGWNDKFSTDQIQNWNSHYTSHLKQVFEPILINYRNDINEKIARIISTQVGPGPQSVKESLINKETGLPK